jgi:RNA polymerase sigma factor (sigma-70 family)
LGKFPLHISDEELVQLYTKEQNIDALGELFIRYKHLIVSICYKYLQEREAAQDATMQIFEKLIKDLPNHNIIIFKAWLHVVSKNYCLMQLRKVKLPIKHTEFIENFNVENDNSLHLALEKEKQLNNMASAIDQLEENQKKCINLFYLNKKSYAEIQQSTGFSFMEVKSYIQNGKRNLKKIMESQNIE